MPKLKTHKGAKSRFHVTGSGKLLRIKCGKSHLRRKKAPRTKRLYDAMIPVSLADKKRVKRLLPYK
ncbi:MAG: 50S ribosomal protein L35 [Dehalococcoidia bacterium]|nr:50S ribosomal protein L35 [Dehalococcoidia bacterium]